MSASKSAVLDHCGHWAQPGAVLDDDEPGYPAKRGNFLHWQAACAIANAPLELDLSLWMSRRLPKLIRWIDAHYGAALKLPECSFAWKDKDVHALGFGMRPEAYPEGSFGGTADLVVWDGAELSILDYKTGRYMDQELLWPQLETLGFMIERWFSLNVGVPIRTHLVGVHCQDGGVTPITRTLDAGVMARFRHRLEMLETPWPSPGKHCEQFYCPMRKGCPSHRAWKGEAA